MDTHAITLDIRSPDLALIDAPEPIQFQAGQSIMFVLDRPLPENITSIYYEIERRMSDNDLLTHEELHSADFGLYTSRKGKTWKRRSGCGVSGHIDIIKRYNETTETERPSRERPLAIRRVGNASSWSGLRLAIVVTSAGAQKIRPPRVMLETANG